MHSNRLRKIAQALKNAAKFNFNYAIDSEKKFATLRGAINKNEGIWNNPNIVHYLKGSYESENEESELEKAVLKHKKTNDIGCVITSIPLNADQFKSKFRVKEDAFLYDEHGVRMHFKVKNNYPETPYDVTYANGETYTKKQVTKKFNSLELLWERSPETQKKIDETPNQDADWYEANKKKIELILSRVPETQYNKKQLSDLKRHKKIEDSQLEKLYDEAEAQGRSSFSGGGKTKTTLKIVHVGVKEAPSFRPGGGTDYKSQIIGISDDFKEKVIVKFGLGTRAGDQLAAAIGLPKQKLKVDHVGIATPTAIKAHLGSVSCEIVSQSDKEVTLKADPKNGPMWEEAVKEFNDLKTGDKVKIQANLSYGTHGYQTQEKEVKILKRSGDVFTVENFIEDVKLPLEDIHDNEDKLVGRKVTVEGEFKPYNGLVFVSRPKFTRAA